MAAGSYRFLFVFVDGLGLAPATDDNPLATEPAPFLNRLLGGPLTRGQERATADLSLAAIDARLGVPGLPQSATGQTTLFTGRNAARHMGRHVTGFPGPRLRALIADSGFLRRVSERGGRATFANAYSRSYLADLENGVVRASATTVAVETASLRFRTTDDLKRARAVTWDIERDLVRSRTGLNLDPIDAESAGRHLAGIAARHDLTLFETFLPDMVGHGRIDLPHSDVVRRLDSLLEGVVACRSSDTTVVVTSDHGNFEVASDRRHSLNQVPLLVIGPAVPDFRSVASITDVAPAMLERLESAGLSAGVSSWRRGQLK